MVGLQGGSGPGWYYRGKHYSSPQDLHEAMSAEMDRLELQVDELVGWLREIHREATVHDLNASLPSAIRSISGRVAKYIEKPKCVCNCHSQPSSKVEMGLDEHKDCSECAKALADEAAALDAAEKRSGLARKCPVCGGDHVEPCAFV